MKLVQFLLWLAGVVAGLMSDPAKLATVKSDAARLLADVEALASSVPPPK